MSAAKPDHSLAANLVWNDAVAAAANDAVAAEATLAASRRDSSNARSCATRNAVCCANGDPMDCCLANDGNLENVDRRYALSRTHRRHRRRLHCHVGDNDDRDDEVVGQRGADLVSDLHPLDSAF